MPMTREIRVLRQGSELARQLLDLFRMPDGAEAAKWGGLVFPILSGDLIEVNGRGLPPAQCQPWEAEAPRWELVAGREGTGSYVFVEGTAHDCRQAEQRLAEADFEVLRSGPNLSGGIGDWFIRLGTIPESAAEKLPGLLGQTGASAPADDNVPLRERLLVHALIASQAIQAGLRTELERVRNAVSRLSSESQNQRSLAESLDAMTIRLAEAEVETEKLRARLEAPLPAATPARATKLETELAIAVAALLPRFDFIGGSIRFVAVELTDRAILWKALAELDRQERGLPSSWKSLSGHSGWWERHFSTGQDNQGRLYARSVGRPSRWQVLVSHKQDQAQDLRRIARM